MAEAQKMELAPIQPQPCSPEEKKLIEASGELGADMTHSLFHKVPEKISPQNFASGIKEILGDDQRIGEIIRNSQFRQQLYKNIDGGITKALEDIIKKGGDIKPAFDALMQPGRISYADAELSLFIASYEAGLIGKSINTWSNKVLGTNLQPNTPVNYNGKKMNYFNAYLEAIKGMTQSQINELKKRCTT